MKQIILSTIGTMVFACAQAQNPLGTYTYRINDKIVKQQVEIIPEEESRQNMVWDLRDLEFLDGRHKVNYTDVYSKKHLVAGVENRSLNYYEQRKDSLLMWGYENNQTKVEYDSPILLLHTPLLYGNHYEGLFHGTYTYCERVFARIIGSWYVHVDGTGMMLLPDGDTLRHVSRVHLREKTALKHYPQITTAKELRAYVDSLPFTSDSIRMIMMQVPQTEKNIYRWYAEGYRYPVLETISTSIQGSGISTIAYYCPPEEQLALDDEENQKVREQLAAIDSKNAGSNDNEQGSNKPSAMSRYDIAVSGQTITIDYDLTEGATVKGLVCNIQGMVFRQQSQTHGAGEHYQMQLDCTGLRRGEYVLHLNVNGQVTSSTVSL